MGGKHLCPLTITEQHMTDFFTFDIQEGGITVYGNFLQRTGNAIRITRELHSRGICQVLTLS